MIKQWSVAVCASLLIAGCGGAVNNADEGEKRANMTSEAQQAKWDTARLAIRRERAKRLEGAPRYLRPPVDPNIEVTEVNGKRALIDKKTGDLLIVQTIDRERLLEDYRFTTKDMDLVCIFMTQMNLGSYDLGSEYPVRVWNIEESADQSPKIREARKRISFERFTQFLSSDPEFKSSTKIVVIDAPVSEDRPL
jgi:hypothetical protein